MLKWQRHRVTGSTGSLDSLVTGFAHKMWPTSISGLNPENNRGRMRNVPLLVGCQARQQSVMSLQRGNPHRGPVRGCNVTAKSITPNLFSAAEMVVVYGGPHVPIFVQRLGTRRHTLKCSVVWLWCRCGVPGLWTKVGTCGPDMELGHSDPVTWEYSNLNLPSGFDPVLPRFRQNS